MKRIQKFAAVNVLAALMGTGIPAIAGQNHYDAYNHGRFEYQSAGRPGDRWDRDRHYQERNYRDNCGFDYRYAPVYDNRYRDDRSHNGRTAAIIGGSAAAGAIIGAAAGRGQGAVVGAVIGGIAGAAVSAATDHHNRR